MAIGDPRVHYDAVYTAVDTAVGAVPTGRGITPDGLPYVSVYAFDGGQLDGSLGAPDDYLEMPIQVTCASTNFEQAQWLQHTVRDALLDQSLTVAGRGLWRLWLEVPSGIRLDDTLGEAPAGSTTAAGGRVFYSTDVFHIKTTP